MLKTEKFYLDLLASANVSPDKDNESFLYINHGKNTKQVTVRLFNEGEDKPLIVPNKRTLKDEEDFDVIKFHPLSESIFRGQSEVFNRLHQLLSLRILSYSTTLGSAIISMALDPGQVSKLRTKPQNQLASLGRVTKTSKTYWNQVLRAVTPATGNNPFVGLAVSRGEGSERLCKLVPFARENEGNAILGVPPKSQSAYNVVQKLIEMLLPDDIEISSASKTAPYFMSLVTCYAEIMTHLNKLAKAFDLDKTKELNIDLGWIRRLENIEEVARMEIPAAYAGNEGLDSDTLAEQEPEVVVEQKPTQAPNPAPQSFRRQYSGMQNNGFHGSRGGFAQRKIVYKSDVPESTPEEVAETESPFIEDEPPHRPMKSNPVRKQAVSLTTKPKRRPAVARHQHQPLPDETVLDYQGNVIYCANGQEYKVPSHEMPTGVVHGTNNIGQPLFNNDGTPVLFDVHGGGIVPAFRQNQHHNQPNNTGMGYNPNGNVNMGNGMQNGIPLNSNGRPVRGNVRQAEARRNMGMPQSNYQQPQYGQQQQNQYYQQQHHAYGNQTQYHNQGQVNQYGRPVTVDDLLSPMQ